MGDHSIKKLSELTTDEAAGVLCEIVPYASAILSDTELLSELREVIDPHRAATKAELIALSMEKAMRLIPIVLKRRRRDVYGILAALSGKTDEEIGRQSFILTMKQIRDTVKDREMLDFFRSCADTDGRE